MFMCRSLISLPKENCLFYMDAPRKPLIYLRFTALVSFCSAFAVFYCRMAAVDIIRVVVFIVALRVPRNLWLPETYLFATCNQTLLNTRRHLSANFEETNVTIFNSSTTRRGEADNQIKRTQVKKTRWQTKRRENLHCFFKAIISIREMSVVSYANKSFM